MVIFLALCLCSYIGAILCALYKYRKAKYCLNKLCDFVAVYSHLKHHQHTPEPKLYAAELTALLRSAPLIEELIRYPKLTYGDSDNDTYGKAKDLLCDIQMLLNRERIALMRSFNPISAAKTVLLFPSKIFKKLGITINVFFSIVISSVITVLLEFLLSQALLNLDVIRSFVDSIFQ